MERLERATLLLAINEELRKQGSWAGETHMQKAIYFLQELMNVPLGFDFILYKHGPFSFDLRDELTFMRAHGFLKLDSQYPYGPTLIAGEKSDLLKHAFRNVIHEYLPGIRFVSQRLGAKTVAGLERTATALYVTLRAGAGTNRVQKLTDLKPHIGPQDAEAALSEVDQIMKELPRRIPA